MSLATRYSKEQTLEVPGCSLAGLPDSRSVRVYVKGPSKGIGPNTRLLVNIHGAGGRPLEIEYKRFRHEVSDAYDCLVVGVDFFGTRSRWVDVLHLAREKERIIESIRRHLPGFDPRSHVDKDGNIYLESNRIWYCDSSYAATQLELETPEDAWDFGLVQAIDVLSAIRVLIEQWEALSLPLPPVHFFSRSAGSQVATLCLALCPNLACTMVHVAPFMMSRLNRGVAELLLTKPLGDNKSAHHGVLKIPSDGWTTNIQRKVPVPFPGKISGIPSLDDQIDQRLMDNDALWKGLTTDTKIVSWRGADDRHMPQQDLTSIHACLSAAGASCRIIDVTTSDVDGKIFMDTSHDLIGKTKDFFAHIAADLLTGDRRPSHPDAWHDRTIASTHGRWCIRWKPSPHFSFEPTHGT